jgi:hypothetical protein
MDKSTEQELRARVELLEQRLQAELATHRPRRSPATVISVLALVAALSGGTAWAATIGTAQIKNGAVTTAKIADGAVTTPKVKNLAVTGGKIASGAVTGSKIATGAVSSGKLASNAVTGSKIAAGAVTSTTIAPASVTTDAIGDAQVTSAKIGDDQITSAKIAAAAVTSDEIASGAVTSAGIANGAVATTDLASSAVNSGKIAEGQVRGTDLGTIVQRTPNLNLSSGAALGPSTVAAQCATGERLISGGFATFPLEQFIPASMRRFVDDTSPNGRWEVTVRRTSNAANAVVSAFAYCLDAP